MFLHASPYHIAESCSLWLVIGFSQYRYKVVVFTVSLLFVERDDVVYEAGNIAEERKCLDVYGIPKLGGENEHGIGFSDSA